MIERHTSVEKIDGRPGIDLGPAVVVEREWAKRWTGG
jgi:hypothetical protein